MQNLIDYLKNLNSSETQWGVWVNPQNVDEYRVGQCNCENGGLLDDYEYIGSLASLSFGSQSRQEALKAMLENNSTLAYQGKTVRFDASAMYEAWTESSLAQDFAVFLEEEAVYYEEQWATEEATSLVADLHDRFTSGEYQSEIVA